MASSLVKHSGSPAALPDVATIGRSTSSECNGVYGNSTPISPRPGAMPGSSTRADAITMGRAGEVSSSSSSGVRVTSRRAQSRSGTMTAKGLSGRFLRRRSSETASSLVASHMRWKPPMPLTARMRPASISARAAAMLMESCGPQLGQLMGCAWKRRSVGVVYSVSQAGHMGKIRMVVLGRS